MRLFWGSMARLISASMPQFPPLSKSCSRAARPLKSAFTRVLVTPSTTTRARITTRRLPSRLGRRRWAGSIRTSRGNAGQTETKDEGSKTEDGRRTKKAQRTQRLCVICAFVARPRPMRVAARSDRTPPSRHPASHDIFNGKRFVSIRSHATSYSRLT